MKRSEFAAYLHQSMDAVDLTPQMKRAALDRIAGKEQPVVKRKMSVALVLALILCLLMAVAVAAAHRAGLLDFLGRYHNSYVPEDAQTYIQTDVATMENELVTATVREMYYDGKVARMVVDITPRKEDILLLGEDLYPEDPWENMKLVPGGEEDQDLRPVTQVYQEGGYQAAYAVSVGLHPVDENVIATRGSMDFFGNEDGTLTIYQQEEYENAPEELEANLRLMVIPWETPLAGDSNKLYEQRVELNHPLRLSQTASATEAYLCSQPVELPSVGVRIDGLLIEVKPQELYATLNFTVIDRAAYDATDNGLWFEFIDPSSTAETPYEQRLMEGLSGGGSIGPVGSDDPNTAVRFRQRETLGRNELHEEYTLRAFDAWEKQRYETVTLVMQPASPEEVAAFLEN